MKAVTYIEIDIPSWVVTSPQSTQTFRFAIPASYLDKTIDAIPSIESISFTPQRIALGESMGQRASLRVNFKDHRHIFAGESFYSGTFFGKWRGRYGNKLRGCPLRLRRGTAEQTIDGMEVRHYVIDACNGPLADGTYTIEAKDPLKYADDDRAVAPFVSDGALAGSISAAATTCVLSPTGIGTAEYPASGWVCLGGTEIVSFTRVSDTLTITRGQLGTTAVTHDAAERVQLVLRYTGNAVCDLIYALLVTYAAVPPEYIDLTEWQLEDTTYMGGVIYAVTITEPTSVRKLVNELIQQASLALYWDDRAAKIKFKVIREIATTAVTFTEDDFIEGSFQVTEQPDKRLSQVWCYYTQRNPADNGAKEDNFKSIFADVDLQRENEYGGTMIKKVQARWIYTLSAATRFSSTQLSRYRDPPRAYAFDLVSGSFVQPAGGYTIRWWGEQDESGNLLNIPIQITCVTFYSDRIHVEAEEMLVSGQSISTNIVFLNVGSGTYTKPTTWNNSNNSIAAIGAGAGGGTGEDYTPTPYPGAAPGGGGGAFSKIVNYSLGASVSYQVGAGGAGGTNAMGSSGTDTWFVSTGVLLAKAGEHGTTSGSLGVGGLGGAAASGVGSTKYSGGAGGATGGYSTGGGGGGGAGGPNGDGAAGGAATGAAGAGGGGADGGYVGASVSGSTGGNGGNNRFNFGGGTSGTPVGQEGGGGRGSDTSASNAGEGGVGEQLWTQSVPPIISAGPGGGGGGGAAYPAYAKGQPGGAFGAGGGGSKHVNQGQPGADGIIVITWQA